MLEAMGGTCEAECQNLALPLPISQAPPMAQLAKTKAPPLIRAATLFDARAISHLIEPFARADQMLPRPVADIIENLRDYKVAFDGDDLVGVAALHLMPPDTAEVRALAVAAAAVGELAN